MAMAHIARHSPGKHQKTVIALLREKHAVGRTTAQPLPDLTPGQRRRVEKLVERGVVRVAAKGRYYIDEDALRELHGRQRAISFAVAIVFAGIGAAWLLMTQ